MIRTRSVVTTSVLALSAAATLAALVATLAACNTPTAQKPAPAVTGGATTCAGASLTLPPDTVVATVDGQNVTAKDLGDEERKAEEKALADYCDAVHQARAQALEGYVTEKLVDRAAKAAGKEADAWVQEEVEKRTKAPTDQEIQAFYESRKRPDAPPLDAVKDQVMMLMTRERNMEAMQGLFDELKKNGKVEQKLPDVRPPPRDVDLAKHTAVKGKSGAKVRVVEFADFQCPYCTRAADAMRAAEKKYGDRVEFAYRHFPLRSIHPAAQRAAEVSQCAREQGKFWEMHDALYADQANIADAIEGGLHANAQKLGLDAAKLDECLASGRAAAEVEVDVKKATELGVEGTPTVFVNGRSLAGGASLESISAAIDAEL
jgi:protein-disulfide isomerase